MVPENTQNRRYKLINFTGLQNNRHPSQHNDGNVHKASGNCQQRSLIGARFADVAAIQERVTAVLRSIPK
jgi:hypothetical protein